MLALYTDRNEPLRMLCLSVTALDVNDRSASSCAPARRLGGLQIA